MRRTILRLAAVGVVAAATLTSTALAGGNPNAPGQQKKDDSSVQQAPPAQQQAPPGQVQQTTSVQADVSASVHTPPGQAKRASASVQAGVKPSATTSKWTHCTTGGSGGGAATCTAQLGTPNVGADVSKRYGNGTTAAQIAVGRGAPDGTLITGPGNSQPHKVTACGKPGNRSGGVDVHAVKSYSGSACAQTKAAVSVQSSATITPPPVVTSTPVHIAPPASTAHGSSSNAPGHGVLGAHTTLAPAKHAPGHGVLGTVARIGGSTLPFTGLRLWLVALLAIALTGAGVAARRAA
jgi:hypothetical protein